MNGATTEPYTVYLIVVICKIISWMAALQGCKMTVLGWGGGDGLRGLTLCHYLQSQLGVERNSRLSF